MRTQRLIVLIGAFLGFWVSSAQAYTLGNWDMSGSALLGARLVSGNAEKHALFNKYRDIQDGLFGDLTYRGIRGDYGMKLEARDIGRQDQFYSLSGAKLGVFDYEFFYSEIINRTGTVGIQGPYAGIGTGTLTTLPGVNVTQNPTGQGYAPFEYYEKHKNFGFSMELFKDSPFFTNLGYNQDLQTGNRVLGHSITSSSSGSPAVQVPEPIDYKTHSVNVDVGYRNDAMLFALDGYYSKFTNAISALSVPALLYNNNAQPADAIMLAQPNNSWSLSGKAHIHNLPLSSTLSAKLGYSKVSSKFDLWTSVLDGGSTTTAPSVVNNATTNGTFDGRYDYKTANLSVASHPIEKLDTRLHYAFLVKHNYSSPVKYAGLVGAGSVASKTFGYKKHIAGLDTSYRLPVSSKLGLDYEFLQITRDREDIPKNSDHKISLILANESLDWLSAHLKYTYLTRLAETKSASTFLAYDAAPKRQNRIALEFDITPAEHMDAFFGYEYMIAKYTDSFGGGGRIRDLSHMASASLGYEFGEGIHASVFGDLEKAYFETMLKAVDDVRSKETELYYTAGTALGVPVTEKADFKMGYQYHRGNGQREFNHRSLTGNIEAGSDTIPNIDDYTKHGLNATVGYKLTKALTAKVGYSFEQVNYSDASFDNYTYLASAAPYADSKSAFSYTGARSDNSYKSHIGAIAAEYRF